MTERDEHVEAKVPDMERCVARTKTGIRPIDERHTGTRGSELIMYLVRERLEPVRELDEDHFRVVFLDILDSTI